MSFWRGGLTCDYWCTIRIGGSIRMVRASILHGGIALPIFPLNKHRPILQYLVLEIPLRAM